MIKKDNFFSDLNPKIEKLINDSILLEDECEKFNEELKRITTSFENLTKQRKKIIKIINKIKFFHK